MASDRIMVSKVKIDRIADAIREMLNEETLYTLDEMPDAIRRIQGGGGGGAGSLDIFFATLDDLVQ